MTGHRLLREGCDPGVPDNERLAGSPGRQDDSPPHGDARTVFFAGLASGGLQALPRRRARIAAPAELPGAIERPSGLIVDVLAQAVTPVAAIHPYAVTAARPRYRAAGGKDNRGDAYLLTGLLRTDGHRFGPLAPLPDEMRALLTPGRGRGGLVANRVALANRPRSLPGSFWPGAAAIFAGIDGPIALAFRGKYPPPHSAARIGPKRMAAVMAQPRCCGRPSAGHLPMRLGAAPGGLAGEDEAEAKGEIPRPLVAAPPPRVQQIANIRARSRHGMAQPPGCTTVIIAFRL